ncbi:putative component of virus defense system, contains PD-(D/E)xK nuclease domain, DUF524 [Abditibacterium utsteinense]|uniref:Putative component of virus defense system, contains PD-(D/E)xK nuclease domain, DUF524 n=1 Tax=Abditibacterium utsteinense TaxID=1960156 RepID=A0A2S8SRF7_9BACT|nr:DUF2357 domain-containing protein [Abditibacterium utsteinense]PQV63402.1 putative component of virus defense system, contains PD-(D/E)xK nuclease domain, DUF524 [Abditibacterium utsteinense]
MTPFPPFLAPEKARFLPVPEELQAAFFPAKLCLFEWNDYWFEWRGATHLHVGEEEIEPFAPSLFRVRWENALGASSIQPFCDNSPTDAPLFVEILSPKFPTPSAHLQFFRALLNDLFRRAAFLIYDFEGQNSRGVESSALAPSPLWTRLFLEQNGARLAEALRFFLAQPERDLGEETVWRPAAQAARFDQAALRQTARDAALWTRFNGKIQPLQVAQNLAVSRLDTPHNRFAAAFARRLISALDDLAFPNLAFPNLAFPEIRGLCAAISARLPAWNDEIRVLPALWQRRASRELLELWRMWNGAGAPLFARFERAARLRDIAQLYEFWTFFALCQQIGAALNQTPRLEIVAAETRGLKALSRARFATGTLVFNGPAPSYSTPLRPDFLWLEAGGATLAFDAKFRLEGAESGSPARGKGADLHKMHAYCDALGVRGAMAIYPGEQSVFFGRSGAQSAFSLGDLLGGRAQGVGFWALRPGL